LATRAVFIVPNFTVFSPKKVNFAQKTGIFCQILFFFWQTILAQNGNFTIFLFIHLITQNKNLLLKKFVDLGGRAIFVFAISLLLPQKQFFSQNLNYFLGKA
jgi:hypothetical protein